MSLNARLARIVQVADIFLQAYYLVLRCGKSPGDHLVYGVAARSFVVLSGGFSIRDRHGCSPSIYTVVARRVV